MNGMTTNASGICLPGTELLQSPFRTEFSMGSRSWRYRRSLRHYRQSLRRSAAVQSPIIARLTKHRTTLLNIVKHHETLKTLWNITKQSNTHHSMRRYQRTIRGYRRTMRRHRCSVQRYRRSARQYRRSARWYQCSAARAEFLTILAWSFWWYLHGVSGDISDCGVGITPQMCNRVTDHGDMGTFSKPGHGTFGGGK